MCRDDLVQAPGELVNLLSRIVPLKHLLSRALVIGRARQPSDNRDAKKTRQRMQSVRGPKCAKAAVSL